MLQALTHHWPEYLIEALLLGTFMVVACGSVVVLNHPESLAVRRITNPNVRRAIIGVLMGLTAIVLIYSPLGQRSGAHMNPATTLTFFALGKVPAWDAAFYILAQFAGGAAGVGVASILLRSPVRHPDVNHAATVPGRRGAGVAWIAEFSITLVLMITVLITSNRASTAAYTGIIAGTLVALYITVEAPLSGMSMNPARTLGSAVHARDFRALWVYFTAPPLGMLCAAGLYVIAVGSGHVYCCKMSHAGDEPCIFNCRIGEMPGPTVRPNAARGIQQNAASRR